MLTDHRCSVNVNDVCELCLRSQFAQAPRPFPPLREGHRALCAQRTKRTRAGRMRPEVVVGVAIAAVSRELSHWWGRALCPDCVCPRVHCPEVPACTAVCPTPAPVPLPAITCPEVTAPTCPPPPTPGPVPACPAVEIPPCPNLTCPVPVIGYGEAAGAFGSSLFYPLFSAVAAAASAACTRTFCPQRVVAAPVIRGHGRFE